MSNPQQLAFPAKAKAIRHYTDDNGELRVDISEEEYKELIDSALFLEALYTAGVDNWEWFDHAVEIHRGDII
ncbi:hypothetical protein [Burkholderia territorii]|uniref:hypothetical protein n=1 Tax=Burkholderia territorii TaxID=1503055 RepID=UPI0012D9BC30|nr:hypothetical protein [Burkholderia territorii]